MRDGEQSPGASMNKDEKVRIAKALERLKVDVMEAGFPAASIGEKINKLLEKLLIPINSIKKKRKKKRKYIK